MRPLRVPNRRRTNSVSVLLVEPNADHWLLIRSALHQCFPEVKPVWITNPAQAITYLETCLREESNLPILILSELYLPRRQDGLSLVTSIKSHLIFQVIPIIVLSHSQDPLDIVDAYQYNIASYIIKPSTSHQWLVTFYQFRRYWWEWVALRFHLPPAHE
ncbi:response regulator [Spirosoma endophyticum]|uniref:CheY chemotaxis protein or a CheY-like REC (Receiver) domain n=1 Tax=Spirosoma endophyticum TaxID=662367 RepID=A0A1I2EAT1_9BACT|nr:response regulator [Spirosoma endophyticum]SFE89350.1 CheY chemotaxis protein or a CheY-like REC (receiver) domain [Spirosoma endophyticum]